MNQREKALRGASLIVSILVVVFALMQLTGIWDKALYVSEPLLGTLMLINSSLYWRTNRFFGMLMLIAAVFIFGCFMVVLLL
ncbi:MAG: hypothetical protein IKL92_04495 [Oscillospiraceae bacterium]|nr:hypothetical protein [Oscillospiraceae bacterium]